jgi:hypothetical protein
VFHTFKKDKCDFLFLFLLFRFRLRMCLRAWVYVGMKTTVKIENYHIHRTQHQKCLSNDETALYKVGFIYQKTNYSHAFAFAPLQTTTTPKTEHEINFFLLSFLTAFLLPSLCFPPFPHNFNLEENVNSYLSYVYLCDYFAYWDILKRYMRTNESGEGMWTTIS